MTALTQAERQQKRRDKKKAGGLVKVELWVKREHARELKKLAESLNHQT